MMLVPLLRMDDGAGHQIVEVQFDGGGAQYAYAWRGQRALSLGQRVVVPPPAEARATVVALGSDYAGHLTLIGEDRDR
jgi:hypothetical protein